MHTVHIPKHAKLLAIIQIESKLNEVNENQQMSNLMRRIGHRNEIERKRLQMKETKQINKLKDFGFDFDFQFKSNQIKLHICSLDCVVEMKKTAHFDCIL